MGKELHELSADELLEILENNPTDLAKQTAAKFKQDGFISLYEVKEVFNEILDSFGFNTYHRPYEKFVGWNMERES